MPAKRTSNTSQKGSRKASQSKETRGRRGSRAQQQEVEARRLLDDQARNDILGVIVAVIGIGLLIAVLSPASALLTKLASDGLHYVFGFGAFVVPLGLIIWAATFFVRTERGLPLRAGIGIVMILLSLISIMAIYTPQADIVPSQVFDLVELPERGGFVGAGIAWALLTLVGRTVGTIILVGLIIAGLIVIGFSISSLVDRIMNRFGGNRDEYGYDRDDSAAAASRFGKGDPVQQELDFDRRPGLVERIRSLIPFGRRNQQDFDYYDDYEPEYYEDPNATHLLKQDEREQATYVGNRTKTVLLDRKEQASDKPVPVKAAKQKAEPAAPKAKVNKPEGAGVAKPTATEGFELPDPDILVVNSSHFKLTPEQEEELNATQERLQDTLQVFGMTARVVGWTAGPTVTTYRVAMGDGERVSKLANLEDDIALSLAASAVRIFSPIPGTSLVGVEIPNSKRSSVTLGDVMPFVKGGPLMLAIGRDVEGNPVTSDLAKMPHLLIAGTTGSGKSVMINTILSTILMRATPDEVRLIMVDPKRVELSGYNGIPQLYVPVVTDPRQAASSLQWAVAEMERRLKIFEKAGARNIGTFNRMVQEGKFEEHETTVDEMPYLVIVIDELTDLMMVAGKDVEASIVRIAQLGRAAGIHLIVATQRPAAEVVTNAIKVNIVNRIAFKVATSVDSRVILGSGGAEKLIGLGDMLYDDGHSMKPTRIQGCFVSDEEIENIVSHLREQGEPDYHEEILSVVLPSAAAASGGGAMGGGAGDDDPLIWEAAEAVIQMKMGSTSGIQRRLKVGYARAGRIMDMLEEKGIVGPVDGTKPREVLVSAEDLETLRAFELSDADKDGEF